MTKPMFVIIMILTSCSSFLLSATDSKIKLHKAKISISAPNPQGLVAIQAQPGAVVSSSTAFAEIVIHKNAGTFNIAPNGSFTAKVQASPGDKIRIQARNQSKKKSYGTFTVPLNQIATPTPNASLAVHLNIIDTQTGNLVAQQKLVINVATDALLKKRIHQLLLNCKKNIEAEIAAWPTQNKKITPAPKPETQPK